MNGQNDGRGTARAPRMRYPEQALAELKQEDPSTPVTVYMIRRLVAAGTVPSIQMGRRRLLNYDALLAYLANPSADEPVAAHSGIRRVSP